MRIAFDLDGVLADLHEPFVREAIRLFPELDAAKIGAADIGASPGAASFFSFTRLLYIGH